MHLIFFIAQLKFWFKNDFFNKFLFDKFNSIFVKNDINEYKLYEIQRFFNKKIV